MFSTFNPHKLTQIRTSSVLEQYFIAYFFFLVPCCQHHSIAHRECILCVDCIIQMHWSPHKTFTIVLKNSQTENTHTKAITIRSSQIIINDFYFSACAFFLHRMPNDKYNCACAFDARWMAKQPISKYFVCIIGLLHENWTAWTILTMNAMPLLHVLDRYFQFFFVSIFASPGRPLLAVVGFGWPEIMQFQMHTKNFKCILYIWCKE